jgi:hypothetical protein
LQIVHAEKISKKSCSTFKQNVKCCKQITVITKLPIIYVLHFTTSKAEHIFTKDSMIEVAWKKLNQPLIELDRYRVSQLKLARNDKAVVSE